MLKINECMSFTRLYTLTLVDKPSNVLGIMM